MNIDEMEAGREMDAVVAAKVMGWHKTDRHFGQFGELWWNVPDGVLSWAKTSFGSFQPSTDIIAAWQVDRPTWEWTFSEQKDCLGIILSLPKRYFLVGVLWAEVDNKALAYALGRCRAALKAVGVEEVERETVPGI